VVHPEVKSPAMTGQWEAYLKRIQRGEAQLEPFIEGIEDYVREVVGKVGKVPAAPRRSKTAGGFKRLQARQRPAGESPESLRMRGSDALLHRAFGFPAFRANQEEVCRTVIEGATCCW
jgi:DNA topoisomerase III